ncbi:MAG: hypothetical protein HOV81_43535 [Kofleriaceae bacterium]|nr:hypothetical protein [Kofleriaceae bacterium]
MLRAAAVALVMISACGKSASNQDKEKPTTPSGDEVIAVPGGEKAVAGSPEGTTPAGTPTPVDDPRFHLQPEEGALTVDKGEAKAGAEATAAVKLAPATGYHIATDYPIKLTLEAPAGVTLAKTEMTAGGRNKLQGDAQTLSEQNLAFAVKATAEKAGAYEIKGVFKFGICEKDSCHPKKQPITITVAAN